MLFCSSVAQLCPTLCNSMDCKFPQSLLKLMSIESMMPSNHLILCCSLYWLPSIFLSIRIFSKKSILCTRWPKYRGFRFSISSVQFSHSVVSDFLRPHELRHARPPCPSPTPGVSSNSCASSGDAIQPSCPLLSPFPPAPTPSQHQ